MARQHEPGKRQDSGSRSSRASQRRGRQSGNEAREVRSRGGYDHEALERHAAMLRDGRLAHPANRELRSGFIGQLQRDYGNAYVQRLMERVSGSNSTVQRAGGDSAFVRVIQNAGEILFFFNQSGRHVKGMAQERLKLLEMQSRLIQDPARIAETAQIANAIINYIEATDHDQAMNALAKIFALVNKALGTMSKEDASDLKSWIPGFITRPDPTPEVLASLQKPQSGGGTAPATPSGGGTQAEEEEPHYNTEEESPYNNVGESPYGVPIPVGGAQEESPYGVPIQIPFEEEEESPYNN